MLVGREGGVEANRQWGRRGEASQHQPGDEGPINCWTGVAFGVSKLKATMDNSSRSRLCVMIYEGLQ